MKRLTLVLGLVALAAVLAACSGTSAATSTPAPASSGTPAGGVSITANGLAFGQTQVSVKAGAPFTIDFDNQESAPHNVAISDASGASVFKGEIVSATKVTYNVPALSAGMYTFICEVHPSMKGTITAQ